jgi:lysophospholipase L1-like esterase
VPGYVVVENLIRLETDLANVQPDLLVVYDGHNDLFAALGRDSSSGFSQRPGRVEPAAPWTTWLEEHSLLYSKVVGRLQAIRSRRRATARAGGGASGSGPAVDWSARVDAATRRFALDLESLVAVARARRIPVALMTVTHVSAGDSTPRDSALARSWSLTVGGTPPPVVLEGYRRYNAAVREIAGRYRLPLIDGEASGVAGPDFYAEGDPIHFNDAGAERFARFVAPQLAQVLAGSTAAPRLH